MLFSVWSCTADSQCTRSQPLFAYRWGWRHCTRHAFHHSARRDVQHVKTDRGSARLIAPPPALCMHHSQAFTIHPHTPHPSLMQTYVPPNALFHMSRPRENTFFTPPRAVRLSTLVLSVDASVHRFRRWLLSLREGYRIAEVALGALYRTPTRIFRNTETNRHIARAISSHLHASLDLWKALSALHIPLLPATCLVLISSSSSSFIYLYFLRERLFNAHLPHTLFLYRGTGHSQRHI